MVDHEEGGNPTNFKKIGPLYLASNKIILDFFLFVVDNHVNCKVIVNQTID